MVLKIFTTESQKVAGQSKFLYHVIFNLILIHSASVLDGYCLKVACFSSLMLLHYDVVMILQKSGSLGWQEFVGYPL